MNGSARPAQSPMGSEGALYVADGLRFIRRNLAWTLGGALAAAVVALVVVVASPPVYQAAALLTLGGDQLAGEPSPPQLSAEGYLRLLQSRPVVAETYRRLEERGLIKDMEVAGASFSSDLLPLRRGEQGNTSLLELVAEADSAEVASAAANTWAGVFLEVELRQVQSSAMQGAYQVLLAERVRQRDRLAILRERLAQLQSRLKATQPTITLRSRLTDRELLLDGAAAGAGSPVIVSQQVNPLYNDLSGQVATTSAEAEAVARQAEELGKTARALKERIDRSRERVARGEPTEAAPEPLPGVAVPAYGSAQLVSSAVPPLQPVARRLLAKVLLAAVGGAILGLLIAALRETVRTLPPSSDPERSR